MSEQKVSRRGYVKYVGGVVVVAVVAAAGYGIYEATKPTPTVTPTPTPTPSPTGKPYAGSEINVLMITTPAHGPAMLPLVPEFESLTGAKVNVVQASGTEIYEKTILDFTGKTGAFDIVELHNRWLPQYANSGHVDPITDEQLEDPEDIAKLERDTYSWKGQLYAIPWETAIPIIIYRKDIFDAKGSKVPGTWEEYYNTAKTFNDPPKLYGTSLRGLKGECQMADYLPIFWSYGAEIFDEEFRSTVNSKEAVEAMKFWISLKEFAPPGSENWCFDENVTFHQQGKLAMTRLWSPTAAFEMEREGKSTVIGKNGWASEPAGPVRRTAFRGGWAISLNHFSKKKEVASAFMKWITNKENCVRWTKLGGASPRTSALKNPEIMSKNPWNAAVYESLEKYAIPEPRVPEAGAIEEVFSAECIEALVGNKKPQEALDAAKARIEDIMDKAGYYK